MGYTQAFVNMVKEDKLPESVLVKMSEFKDRLHSFTFTKTAADRVGWPSMLLMAGALGAVPYVAGGIGDAISSYKENRAKEPAFLKMLEYHPQLQAEDPITVRRYFESMWHFSPHMAQDPLAAGSYIRQALNFHSITGGPAANMAKDLAGLQKDFITANSDRGRISSTEEVLKRIPTPKWEEI